MTSSRQVRGNTAPRSWRRTDPLTGGPRHPLSRAEEERALGGLPRWVERELRSYLACGILARGFCRVHCSSCGADVLVQFSCKGRGFCPSCGGRRMAEAAAHLCDHVMPEG
jgi:hypothetical protein